MYLDEPVAALLAHALDNVDRASIINYKLEAVDYDAQDYSKIAAVVRRRGTVKLAVAMALMLADSERFDHLKFMNACG